MEPIRWRATGAPNRVGGELAALWRRRELLWILVRRDLKVRYKNSRLGFLWSIAPPLLQVIVITFALKRATNFASGFDNYSAYVLAALVPWTYFQTAILDSSQSLLVMQGVIKKVPIPREIIPLSLAVSNFVHFLLSWVVFLIYLWGYLRVPFHATVLWLPYLVLVQFFLVTGFCLIVSCLNVFYEDVKYIVTTLMGLGLFVLPIMYVVEQPYYNPGGRLHGWLFQLYYHQPLTELITGYRKVLLEPEPYAAIKGQPFALDIPGLLFTGLLSFLFFLAAYWYFNKRKWQFVERP